jgi:hypothetical protein
MSPMVARGLLAASGHEMSRPARSAECALRRQQPERRGSQEGELPAGDRLLQLKNQTPNTRYTWNITTVGAGGRYCSSNSPDATQPGDLTFTVACFQGTTLKNTTFTFEFNAN